MGHSVGLDHYNDCGGAMNSEYLIGGSKRLIVRDDANGIRAIYGAGCRGNATTDEKCYGGCPGRYSICFRYRGMDKGLLLVELTEALEPFRVPGCFMDHADAVYAACQEEIDAFACVHPDLMFEIVLLADELATGLDVPLTPIQELGKTLTAEDIAFPGTSDLAGNGHIWHNRNDNLVVDPWDRAPEVIYPTRAPGLKYKCDPDTGYPCPDP